MGEQATGNKLLTRHIFLKLIASLKGATLAVLKLQFSAQLIRLSNYISKMYFFILDIFRTNRLAVYMQFGALVVALCRVMYVQIKSE